MGRGCGAVDRAVASKTGDSQFESLYRQQNISNVIICQLQSRKDKNKEKEAGNGPLKKSENVEWNININLRQNRLQIKLSFETTNM